MKTVYIPKGETVCYESLVTEHLVVNGCLKVTYGIKARTISGNGVICAGSVESDTIRMDSVEAASVICKRLISNRVQAPEVFASESAAVSCFLSAAYVETGRLTVAVSEIDQVKAQEIINLTPRKRSLFGTLLASAIRSFWTELTAPKGNGEAMDAECRKAAEDEPATQADVQPDKRQETSSELAGEAAAAVDEQQMEPVDMELKRFIAMFKLMRDAGYTLKVVPNTPEENAPVFDFESERIIRPAA